MREMEQLSETAKVGSIAKSVLIGGALGGFFDDPVTKINSTTTSHNFPSLQNNSQVILANGNSGQDSTESSFT